MNIADKRKKIIDYMVSVLSIVEKHGTGQNTNRYRQLFESKTDAQLSKFMNDLRDGKEMIYITTQNMTKSQLNQRDIIDAATHIGLELQHRIWMTDKATGVRMLTPHKYLVTINPVRRAQQYQDKKLSVAKHDKKIDMMSGQVTGDSASSKVTGPEGLILTQRGLVNTAIELLKVRGGDVDAYDEFARSCYETGSSSLNNIDPNSKARSSIVTKTLFKGMMIDIDL